MVIPDKVKFILDALSSRGYEAYAVGGCVRDSLLGRLPEDWDITTSATPEQIKKVFRTTIDTGIEHGTVTVMLDREGFEVTTYRIEGVYEDSRHPREVAFTSSLTEDLRRRDFTINAMAYNPQEGLVDIFGGIKDMQDRLIRCVGQPMERFSEDALRILRAVRFSAQLDFEIEERTEKAMTRLATSLTKISAERIQKELCKLLSARSCGRIRKAFDTGIMAVLLPELEQLMNIKSDFTSVGTMGEHCIRAMEEVRANRNIPESQYGKEKNVLKWTMLFHDLKKPEVKRRSRKKLPWYPGHEEKSASAAREILKRLKFDNDTMEQVYKLILYHGDELCCDKAVIRKEAYKVGAKLMPLLFEVKRAELAVKRREFCGHLLTELEQEKKLYDEILKDGDCISLKQLKITGDDLLRLGVPQGRQIGLLLNGLLEEVLENPWKNSTDYLIEEVKKRQKT